MTLYSPVPTAWDRLAAPLPDGWVRCGYCGGTGVQIDSGTGEPLACTAPECRGGILRPGDVF